MGGPLRWLWMRMSRRGFENLLCPDMVVSYRRGRNFALTASLAFLY